MDPAKRSGGVVSSTSQSKALVAVRAAKRMPALLVRYLPRYHNDREFLPAALEILETPPSPVQMGMLWSICALVAVAIIWAFVGRIDILAVAQGKIQPTGRVKLVQPLETGKVTEVLVSNGSTVTEAQKVIALDASEAHAEVLSLAGSLASYRAEVARRGAAIDTAQHGDSQPPVVAWPYDLPPSILAREQRVLVGDLSLLQASLASLTAQIRQKEAEQDRLAHTIASQQEQLKIDEQRTELRGVLEAQKLGTKLSLYDAMEALQAQRTSLAQQQGQLAEAKAAAGVLARDYKKAIDSFVSENGQKLADAERQVEDLTQKLAKARAKESHMALQAPVAGTVQALAITSIGQVVMAGEEIMRIVPDEARYEIECYLPNQDIGFVKVGQQAVVKIESFPFTRYGTLPARVKRVSTEAIPEPDAGQHEGDPARPGQSVLLAGAQRMQNLVFPVTLELEQTTIATDGGDVPVSNGMAVTVEIKTGYRRVIDYLFSPLVEVASRALKER
jgi:hemolysin D